MKFEVKKYTSFTGYTNSYILEKLKEVYLLVTTNNKDIVSQFIK